MIRIQPSHSPERAFVLQRRPASEMLNGRDAYKVARRRPRTWNQNCRRQVISSQFSLARSEMDGEIVPDGKSLERFPERFPRADAEEPRTKLIMRPYLDLRGPR
jgi:hypothetical protein